MKGANKMNPYNKIMLMKLMLNNYPHTYEEKYQALFSKIVHIKDDNTKELVKLFDEFEDYIIDCLCSLIEKD